MVAYIVVYCIIVGLYYCRVFTIQYKELKATAVVIWRYINKTEWNWTKLNSVVNRKQFQATFFINHTAFFSKRVDTCCGTLQTPGLNTDKWSGLNTEPLLKQSESTRSMYASQLCNETDKCGSDKLSVKYRVVYISKCSYFTLQLLYSFLN